MSEGADTKSLEELENEIVDLKIRLRRVESFIQNMPTPEYYIPDETFDDDDLLDQAIETVRECDAASASLLQRRLSIGYARAARLMDLLEAQGIVSEADGSKPRKVLINEKEKRKKK